ncbi:ankyrin repeat domain-containing protein 26-like [Felis catus]|uniref:ankyrin repeat domain-containing protein 26-like n=1 Tax=Felis catus TaxID=9685 RepID=UPI0009487C6F|nr:ankyrin repeat domain-containing protein 26-like [Felis catus]
MEAKEDGVGVIENVPPEQTVNGSLTSAGGVHKNDRSDMMSALELGEEEDVESLSLPENMSENPNKYVPRFSGAADQKGQSILKGQVEGADKNAEEDSITRLSDKPGPDDSWPTSASQDFDFGTKNVPKPCVAKLLHSSWQFMKHKHESKTWHCETRRWNLI